MLEPKSGFLNMTSEFQSCVVCKCSIAESQASDYQVFRLEKYIITCVLLEENFLC